MSLDWQNPTDLCALPSLVRPSCMFHPSPLVIRRTMVDLYSTFRRQRHQLSAGGRPGLHGLVLQLTQRGKQVMREGADGMDALSSFLSIPVEQVGNWRRRAGADCRRKNWSTKRAGLLLLSQFSFLDKSKDLVWPNLYKKGKSNFCCFYFFLVFQELNQKKKVF